MTEVKYFLATQHGVRTLLRRADAGDEAFVEGRWQPSGRIRLFEQGFDRWVRPVSELEARTLVPHAFTPPLRTARPTGRFAGLLRRSPLRQQWDEA